jgi:hypothetical protein
MKVTSFTRFAVVFTAAGLAGACSSVDSSSPSVSGIAPSAAVDTSSQATILVSEVQRDLGLELRRTSSEPLDHERDPRLEVWLANRSATRTYPVVLANDGSEVGWREPHAYFNVELLRASGVWEPAPKETGGRCGLYAVDWAKDIVSLAPGERVKMPWMPFYGSELADATKVRIVAYYTYGKHARDKSKVPPLLHTMPEYTLTSAPLEIPVAHPYGLELRIKGPLPTSPGVPVASAVDVVVENRSGKTLPVGTSETGAQLWLEAVFANTSGTEEERTLMLDTEPTYASKDTLRAGAKKSVVTAATKTDVIWSLDAGQRLVKMRAVWRIWDEDGGRYPNVRRVDSP